MVIQASGSGFRIDTAHTVMREMTLDDIDFLAQMMGDPEVMRFYPRCYSRAEVEGFVRRELEHYRADGFGLWMVVDRVSQQPYGRIGLRRQPLDAGEEFEIGYMIHRPFWRRGLATECALATKAHAFDVLSKRRVISLIRPANLPSQGVARKLGMEVIGSTDHGGYEHLVFAVTRER
jgi:RimJ/RimL family protein N-acetyltransferase